MLSAIDAGTGVIQTAARSMVSTIANAARHITRQIGPATGAGFAGENTATVEINAANQSPTLKKRSMAQSSNIKEVAGWLRSIVDGFSFLRPGIDQSLGRDLVNVVAAGIADRSSQGVDATGAIWMANDPDYDRDKAQHYGWSDPPPVNYRTGQMLSMVSLRGTPDIREHAIEMRYGTGDSPGGSTYSPADSRKPHHIRSDDAVSDVDKAGYAIDNDRGFYAPDETILDAVIEASGEALVTYIKEVN